MILQELEQDAGQTFERVVRTRKAFAFPLMVREVGHITSVSAGVVKVSGLRGVGFEEMLEFPGGLLGLAYNIDRNGIGAIVLGEDTSLRVGAEVRRTGRVMDVAVGDHLIGRVVTPLGEPLDTLGPVHSARRYPIERPAPAILDRKQVTVPFQTGLKVIDALVPIGRGQRELILGDRQTGKTAIALDAIINQHDKDMVCVYCAIGQRASSVARVVSILRESGAMQYTVVVVTEGNDSPGLKYIAPYAATSIAEFFMEKGRDVLIVYDDLTNHARAYRELSLLLRRPPSREAFPGDIFYIHSRLLERATRLDERHGGGSLTALPIVETEAQNISAYIPTNLISITDGQIYLSPKLFELGVLPAVDVTRSVSRVGGKAQLPAYRSVIGKLKLAYAQFEELENYLRFGTKLDKHAQAAIDYGTRIREWLKQSELEPISVAGQLLGLLALTSGLMADIPTDEIILAEKTLQESVHSIDSDVLKRLTSDRPLTDDDRAHLLAVARQALARFRVSPDTFHPTA